MRVRFWGVRGSVPWTTAESVGVGANTPCVQVSDGDALLILDAGTGIVGVGELLESTRRPVTVLLSHYHWDHVQAIPFFNPLFDQGATTSIIGPAFDRVRPDWLRGLFAAPHFPLTLSDLASPPSFSTVDPGPFQAGGFSVTAGALMHPGGCFAYRVHNPRSTPRATGEATGDATGDLVYATDHEFGDPKADAAFAAFARGAGAIVMDAHYTPDEMPRMGGRGHGSWQQCAEFAAANDVKQLWLFHHKPGRTDAALRAIERDAQRIFPATRLAVEGVEFDL